MRNRVASAFLVGTLCLPMAARGESAAPASPAASATRVDGVGVRPLETASKALREMNQPDADWQREYDEARAKKGRARTWMLVGAGVTAAGVAMIASKTAVFEDCDFFVCTIDYRLPATITATGVSALVWGIIQNRDANRTIRDLDAQRQLRTPPAGAFLWSDTTFTVAPNHASVVHALRW